MTPTDSPVRHAEHVWRPAAIAAGLSSEPMCSSTSSGTASQLTCCMLGRQSEVARMVCRSSDVRVKARRRRRPSLATVKAFRPAVSDPLPENLVLQMIMRPSDTPGRRRQAELPKLAPVASHVATSHGSVCDPLSKLCKTRLSGRFAAMDRGPGVCMEISGIPFLKRLQGSKSRDGFECSTDCSVRSGQTKSRRTSMLDRRRWSAGVQLSSGPRSDVDYGWQQCLLLARSAVRHRLALLLSWNRGNGTQSHAPYLTSAHCTAR